MLSWSSGQRVPNKSREERQQWWERDGESTRLLILQFHRPPQDPLKSFSGLNCFELRFCHLIYEKPMPNYRGPNLGKVYAGHRQGRRQDNNCPSCTFWHNLHHRGCKGQSPNHVLRNHPDPGVFRHCFLEPWASAPPKTPMEQRAVRGGSEILDELQPIRTQQFCYERYILGFCCPQEI